MDNSVNYKTVLENLINNCNLFNFLDDESNKITLRFKDNYTVGIVDFPMINLRITESISNSDVEDLSHRLLNKCFQHLIFRKNG